MRPLKPFEAHNAVVHSHNAIAELLKNTLNHRIHNGLYELCQENRGILYKAYLERQRIDICY